MIHINRRFAPCPLASGVDRALAFCYFAALKPGRSASGGLGYCPFAAAPKRQAERERVTGEITLVQIFVRDNNVDQALKALKKKMQREGSFREMKRHVHYEKPSEKRARQKAEAVRRARKLARKRAQREGLIPAPKKPAPR
jgi:small subunit ribosomal protein S21